MKIGTPGFIGARLREAREARGLTAISLADVIGLTRSAISLYESGAKTPSPAVLQRISDVLHMPDGFFRYSFNQRSAGRIFYRSMMAATKSARRRAEHRYTWLREIVHFLRNYVDFPDPHIPRPDVSNEAMSLSMDQIEEIAVQARRFYNLGDGPIPNLVSLLENNGVIIARDELGADTLDAYSEFDQIEQTLYMTLGIENASAVRSRFDAAHELGHALIHTGIDSSRFGRPAEYKLYENQAHRFAAAFLLPAQSFAREFYSATLDSLQAIKAKWKVSIAMMIVRAKDLNFISDEAAKRLWIAYSRRKWTGNEPLDDKITPEQPQLLRLSFLMLLEKNVITIEDITTGLPFSHNDIERLAGLDEGFLSKKSAEYNQPVIRLKNRKSARRTTLPRENGLVVQFPSPKDD